MIFRNREPFPSDNFTSMKVKLFLVFLSAILLLSSCNISGRYHHRGWNIDMNWPSKAKDKIATGPTINRKVKEMTVPRSEGEVNRQAMNVTAPNGVEIKPENRDKYVEFTQNEIRKSAPRLARSSHAVFPHLVISPTDSMKQAARVNKIKYLEMRGDDYLDVIRGCVAAIGFLWAIIFATGGEESTSTARFKAGFILFIISLLFVPFLVLFSLLYVINKIRIFVLRNHK